MSLLYAVTTDFNGTVVEPNHFAGDPGSVVPGGLPSQYVADGFNQIHPLIFYEWDCMNANTTALAPPRRVGKRKKGGASRLLVLNEMSQVSKER